MSEDPEVTPFAPLPEHEREARAAWWAAWFRPAMKPYQRPDLVVPLIVLAVADAVAGKRWRRVTVTDLWETGLPLMAIDASLRVLRALGYIRTDGQTIHILRTPLDDERATP